MALSLFFCIVCMLAADLCYFLHFLIPVLYLEDLYKGETAQSEKGQEPFCVCSSGTHIIICYFMHISYTTAHKYHIIDNYTSVSIQKKYHVFSI